MLCNYLVRTLKIILNILYDYKKLKKSNLISCSENLKSTFFSQLPWLPKWPKQKNSCSKMWPIDQLYIVLGFNQKFNPQNCKYIDILKEIYSFIL